MPNMAVGHTYVVRIYCQMANQISINNVAVNIRSIAGGNMAIQDWANGISTDLGGLYIPALGMNASYYGLDVQDVTTRPYPVATSSISGQAAGSTFANCLPGQVSGIISRQGVNIGKSNRSRTYLPFPPSNTLTGSPPVVTAPQVAFYQAIANYITGTTGITIGGTTVTSDWGTFKFGRTLPFIAMIANRVTNRWATQRRRGDFGKPNTPPF